MRISHGGCHTLQLAAMRSEKCLGRCARKWDAIRVIAGCFPRTLQRYIYPTKQTRIFSFYFKRFRKLLKLATGYTFETDRHRLSPS